MYFHGTENAFSFENAPAPFIYEKIGTKYNNYFIDEFQDTSRVTNVINEQGKLKDGLNFVNLYRLISNSLKNDSNENEKSFKYNPSDLLRELYDDLFFTQNLMIPNDKINEFLLYCDDNFPDRILLQKDNEFELIDFLVKQSKKFVKSIAKS